MLLYAVLATALACPCPPAPTGSEVCGSDLVTYDSQCHLECAAVQGLSLKHPGPCSATEWDVCYEEHHCDDLADCGCGKGDYSSDCTTMCLRNCGCGCGGYPPGGQDGDLWKECYDRRDCGQCMDPCRGEECEDQCRLEWYKCDCECLQQAYPAPQRKRNWTACLERRQCHNTTCGECTGAGTFCDKRCKRRCECNCAGWPRRDLSGEWEECFIGTQTCEQAHSACVRECGDQDDCKDKCYMARLDCSCACHTAEEEEWRLWDECTTTKRTWECKKERCECDELDGECSNRCRRNCLCSCLGITADRLDDSVQQCQIDNKCQTTREDCLKDCDKASDKASSKASDKASDKAKRIKCKHACILTSEKCNCECARSRPPKRDEIIQHCNFLS